MGVGVIGAELGAQQAGRSVWRRAARAGGLLLVVAGLLTIVWTLVVWRWQDPVTSLYTWWQQRALSERYAEVEQRYRAPEATVGSPSRPTIALASVARDYRREAGPGAAVARLTVPRVGLQAVVVNGTDSATLKKGPGRHARTFMPGEGELVYIAGHRTTFGAPFARIDALRPGDPITVETPYGTFTYRAQRHSIVDASDLSVLRSHGTERLALQACHPRFFATQRYIVWAELESVHVAPALRGRVTLPRLAG